MEENKVIKEFVPFIDDVFTVCEDELSAFEWAIDVRRKGGCGLYSSEVLDYPGDYTRFARISVGGEEYKFIGVNDLEGKRHFYLYKN